MALVRNENINPAINVFANTPAELLVIIFNYLAKENDGWKILMPLFLSNKDLYSLFQDDQFLKCINLNLASSFTSFRLQQNPVSLDKINHVLMANYFSSSKRLPSMKRLLEKNNIYSQNPELYTKESMDLVMAEKNKLDIALKEIHQQKEIIAVGAGVLTGAAFACGWMLNSYINPRSEVTFLPSLVISLIIVLIGLCKDMYDKNTVKNLEIQRNLTQAKFHEMEGDIKQVEEEEKKKLTKYGKDISLDRISTKTDFNRLFKVNNVLKNPDDPKAKQDLERQYQSGGCVNL